MLRLPLVPKILVAARQRRAGAANRGEQTSSRSTPGPPEALWTFVTAELSKWAGVIKDAGISMV
jgi:hypothetical protein